MRLFVLAGGFGTRLKSVVYDVPKALAPIEGVPFMQLQINNWLKQGIREFTFLLYHQADQIIEFLKEQNHGQLKDCKVSWFIDPMPLDTGGAVANAVNILGLKGNFLVANADTWLGGDISEFLKIGGPAIAIVNLRDVGRYGQVHFDAAQRVTAFSEKNGQFTEGWVNAGLYRLSHNFFTNWNGQSFSLERELFVDLVQQGVLSVVPMQTDFIDIGIPEDYYRFCRWVGSVN